MKRLSGIIGAWIFLSLAFIGSASAQQVNNYCWVSNGPPVQWAPCSAANPLAITGAGGGGLSVVDSAAWTTGVSPFTPSGGVFNDAATLSTGTQGTFRLTTKRAQIIDVDSVGNQLHTDITSATPAGANTIGNVKIVDTAGTNLATVKPASTAPVATDTSFVTALNPNSPGIITLGGATPANSVPTVGAGFTFGNMTTSTTTTFKSGAGVLHTVTINQLGTVASTVSIFYNTAGSGTSIAVLNSLSTGEGTYTYDVAFTTGLTVTTTGTAAPNVTVSYR